MSGEGELTFCVCCYEVFEKDRITNELCHTCYEDCARICDSCGEYDLHEDPQDPYDWVNGMCSQCDPSIKLINELAEEVKPSPCYCDYCLSSAFASSSPEW